MPTYFVLNEKVSILNLAGTNKLSILKSLLNLSEMNILSILKSLLNLTEMKNYQMDTLSSLILPT